MNVIHYGKHPYFSAKLLSEPAIFAEGIVSTSEWYPTVAANGTIYFGSDREGGKGRTDIYRSRLVNGKYTEPENLGDAINTQFNGVLSIGK